MLRENIPTKNNKNSVLCVAHSHIHVGEYYKTAD